MKNYYIFAADNSEAVDLSDNKNSKKYSKPKKTFYEINYKKKATF